MRLHLGAVRSDAGLHRDHALSRAPARRRATSSANAGRHAWHRRSSELAAELPARWSSWRASRSAPPSARASCATCTTAWARTSARPSASCSPGKASHDEVLQTLRDSLDQLKLVDRRHEPAAGRHHGPAGQYALPAGAALCGLRHRTAMGCGPARAAGTASMPRPCGSCSSWCSRRLSNVLQHAQASCAAHRGASCTPGGGAQLRVIDNGCGFDPRRARRAGACSSLRERAAAIGATPAHAPARRAAPWWRS